GPPSHRRSSGPQCPVDRRARRAERGYPANRARPSPPRPTRSRAPAVPAVPASMYPPRPLRRPRIPPPMRRGGYIRSEEHTSELQSRFDLVCRLLLQKKSVSSTLLDSIALV